MGSSNLATGAVYRQKLGASSVGTTAQGTLTAAKVIGTLATIDVGSALLSYGSAGSTVGAFARFRYGSLSGTFQSPNMRGRVGSFTRYGGSVNAAKVTHGSLGLGRVPPLGSLRGSVPLNTKAFGTLADTRLPRQLVANKGTVSSVMGSFARYGGSIRAPLITHGSLGLGRVPPLGSLRGSVPLNTKAFGTLGAARHQLIQNIPGTITPSKSQRQWTGFGTISGAVGSYNRVRIIGTIATNVGSAGTATFGFARARYGSFGGTVRAPYVRGATGSFTRVRITGSIVTNVGSHGTTLGGILRFRYGSYAGTVRAPYVRGVTGSFTRYGGSLNAAKIIHGSIGAARLPVKAMLGGQVEGVAINNNALAYYGVNETSGAQPASGQHRTYFSSALTLRNLRVWAQQISSQPIPFAVLRNGTPSGLTVTATSGTNSFNDLTNTAAIAAGDYLEMRIRNATGAQSTVRATWTIELF